MDIEKSKQRLKDIFETTIESDLWFDKKIDDIDYYTTICKAATSDKLFHFRGNNLCMLNCKYEESNSVLILFSIPINTEQTAGSKGVAERVMEIVHDMEVTFTTLDFMNSVEIKEDKFVYVIAIKKIEN